MQSPLRGAAREGMHVGTTTRDELIAIEQKAVHRAYDCYAERLAELNGQSSAAASASGKDSVANRQAAEELAAEYDGLGDESLAVQSELHRIVAIIAVLL